ncbi:MAG: ATP-binding protein [Armatimonadota bacterium]
MPTSDARGIRKGFDPVTHTPPENQDTSDDAPDLERGLASYFAAGQQHLQQVREAALDRHEEEMRVRGEALIETNARHNAWAFDALTAHPQEQFAEASATALADSPAFPEVLKWKVATTSPSCIKVGIDGWNFRHDALPRAESSDWQTRLCRAACSIYASGQWASNFVQGNSVWVLPAQPGPQALRPENQMALLAGILGSQFPLPPPDLLFCGALDNVGNFLPLKNPLAVAKAAQAAGGWAVVPQASFDLVKAAYGRTIGVGNACDLWNSMIRFRTNQRWDWGPMPRVEEVAPTTDLAHVAGQKLAKRALEIAVAGGHDLLLVGPPGEGKSLLASCLPGIAPPLTREQALEVAAAL